MRTRLSVAVLLIVLPFAAHAQKAAPADAQAITACLKKAEDQGTFGGGCIGLVADPCITAGKGKNSDREDWQNCAARELGVWTALMAEALRRANGDAEMKAAIAESQKAFAVARDKLCPVFDRLDPGMAPGGANYCRLQETARRVLNLRRLADAVNPH